MEELLFKFETEKERNDFEYWFSEYGQYYYYADTAKSIKSVDVDIENHIINIE
jgi:hypothetical protein